MSDAAAGDSCRARLVGERLGERLHLFVGHAGERPLGDEVRPVRGAMQLKDPALQRARFVEAVAAQQHLRERAIGHRNISDAGAMLVGCSDEQRLPVLAIEPSRNRVRRHQDDDDIRRQGQPDGVQKRLGGGDAPVVIHRDEAIPFEVRADLAGPGRIRLCVDDRNLKHRDVTIIGHNGRAGAGGKISTHDGPKIVCQRRPGGGSGGESEPARDGRE